MGSTLKTVSDQVLYITLSLSIKVFSNLVSKILGHEWNQDCMELGLRFSENDVILFYIIFILSLCLFFIYLCICYFTLFTSRHISLTLLTSVFGTMQRSGMERLFGLVNSLQPLTAFTESFFLDVCTGSVCVSGYFVLIETINLLMQQQKDKSKSNTLLLFVYQYLIILLIN